MADLSEQIQQAAETPAAASQDGSSATARPINDLIAADKYLASKQAASTTGLSGLGRQVLKPPSALG